MIKDFLKKHNVEIMIHEFPANCFTKVLSSKFIQYCSSDFIKPKMKEDDFIETIVNETRILTIRKG